MSDYRVIVASTEGGVLATAQQDGWTILKPIRAFSSLDTDDDNSLGDVGGILIQGAGFIALARKG